MQTHATLTENNEYEEEKQGPRTPYPCSDEFVNPEQKGTKAAAHYVFDNVPGKGGCAVVRLKLTPSRASKDESLTDEGLFDDTIEERRGEADEFYYGLAGSGITDDFKQIMRQALAGMLWSKQFYQFIQKPWIEGDPAQPPPPPERKWVRNRVSNVAVYINPSNCMIGMASHAHRRHLVHARQMGIPFLCSVGLSFPLHTPRNGRSRLCKATAQAPSP